VQMKDLNSQLVESVRTWIFQNLPYDQRDGSPTSYLNGLDARELLTRYHNWSSRFIRPRPRTVLKSAEFSRNPIALQRARDLALLIDDIEQGRDLMKYLSKAVVRSVVRASGPTRRGVDRRRLGPAYSRRVGHGHKSSAQAELWSTLGVRRCCTGQGSRFAAGAGRVAS
jgi:hypothetical protein